MRAILIFISILISAAALAQPETPVSAQPPVTPNPKIPHPEIPKGEERIQAGTMILISEFDESLHAYLIRIASNGAIGPLYADLEALAASISTIDLARVRVAPKSIVTNYYHADRDVRLLTDAVVDKRRANAKH